MKLFVWDFHGVLEKDNEKAVIEISNHVLAQGGYTERFTEKDNERFYGLKWYQYFERLLPRLSNAEHQTLQAACFKYAEKNLGVLKRHVKPNDHAIDVLSRIKDSGSKQIVVSNSRQSDLVWFLNIIGIKQFFEDNQIIGVNAHQEHLSKRDALEAFLQGKKFDAIIAIGDSEDDLAMGKEFHATTYFYKHPYREHEDTKNADYIIDDLRNVLQELE